MSAADQSTSVGPTRIARDDLGVVVDALYHALLGRAPDEAGRQHWLEVGSVDAVVVALVATDEFRRRAAASGPAPEDALHQHLRAAARLDHGNGCVALADLPFGTSQLDVLDTLPWPEIVDRLDHPVVRVLGPYAEQLATEIVRRCETEAVGGWDDLPPSGRPQPSDVLVLTDPQYFAALMWSRPHHVAAVSRRLLLPLVPGRSPTDEHVRSVVSRWTAPLHDAGFSEVRCAYLRPHGDRLVHLQTSHVTPDSERPRVVRHDTVDALAQPAAVWLTADRLPRSELR